MCPGTYPAWQGLFSVDRVILCKIIQGFNLRKQGVTVAQPRPLAGKRIILLSCEFFDSGFMKKKERGYMQRSGTCADKTDLKGATHSAHQPVNSSGQCYFALKPNMIATQPLTGNCSLEPKVDTFTTTFSCWLDSSLKSHVLAGPSSLLL